MRTLSSLSLGLAVVLGAGAASANPTLIELTSGTTGYGANGITTSASASAYFVSNGTPSGYVDLYRTEGTAASTVKLETYPPSGGFRADISPLGVGTKGLYYTVQRVLSLYGTTRVTLGSPTEGRLGPMVGEASNGIAYFYVTRTGGVSYAPLFRSDGTAAGTRSLTSADLVFASSPAAVLGGKAYFITGPGEINATDGTSTTTLYSSGAPSYRYARELTACDGKLFAIMRMSGGEGLYVSDGVTAPSKLYEQTGFSAAALRCAGNKLFFIATDTANGSEPWVTDGTVTGTRLLRDIYPGAAGSSVLLAAAGDGRVYFTATDPAHGRELWTSDGTPAGTVLLADLVPGPTDGGCYFPFLTNLGGRTLCTRGSSIYELNGTTMVDRTSAFAGFSLPAGATTAGATASTYLYGGSRYVPASGNELIVVDPSGPWPSPDAGPADGAVDSSPVDSGAAMPDTAVTDTRPADTSVADTNVADTSVADTSVADTSVADTSVADTSTSDADENDADMPADTSAVDSGGPVATPAPANDDGSCACSAPGAGGPRTGLGALALLGLLLLRRRRA